MIFVREEEIILDLALLNFHSHIACWTIGRKAEKFEV